MIIVTGSATARAGELDALLKISTEHVLRSRKEPGCISHSVNRDTENPNRLVFFEEWADRSALAAHFAVPASKAFVRALVALVSEPPRIKIYDATLIDRDAV